MADPFVSDPDFQLHVGDALGVLRDMPAESVHCVVTSPPYWGLRDYGTIGQLGLEATPDQYVANMVNVFREVRRVLRADGTVWLNIGDSYAVGGPNRESDKRDAGANTADGDRRPPSGLKPKDLVGIPWRLAFALQADGWYLRSDIIWSKPNPMPESVTDRPTKAHEYLFLLTKSPRYFYDADAIREPHHEDGRRVTAVVGKDGSEQHRNGERWPNSGRNKRSVWEIATEAYPDAHFATFPQALVEPCVKAGCPEWVCGTCGKARERIVERGPSDYERLGKNNGVDFGTADSQPGNMGQTRTAHGTVPSLRATAAKTVGWSDCGHNNYQAGVVLDPFLGSGTTALVARRLGRTSIGIELSPEYAQLAARRLSQQSLFACVVDESAGLADEVADHV